LGFFQRFFGIFDEVYEDFQSNLPLDVNIESKIFEILSIQLSADISFTVYSLCRGRKERDSVVFKYINISDMNIEKIFQILRNV
jgi:hypothetical protein